MIINQTQASERVEIVASKHQVLQWICIVMPPFLKAIIIPLGSEKGIVIISFIIYLSNTKTILIYQFFVLNKTKSIWLSQNRDSLPNAIAVTLSQLRQLSGLSFWVSKYLALQ